MAEHDALDPEQNPSPKIKVTDRRKFDAEGNRRPEAEDDVPPESASPAAEPERIGDAQEEAEERQAAPPSAGPAADAPGTQPGSEPRTSPSTPGGPSRGAAGPSGIAGGGADDADVESAGTAGPAAAAGESPSPDDLPRDFGAFVEGQYFETLLYLGAMRHPQTGEVVEDLDMAKYKIDILSMLQEKTEGNLTAEESKLIEDVVYQLRMAFLQKQKVAKL